MMFWFGVALMVFGLIIGLMSIYKAAYYTISPVVLGWACYGGLFIALLGAVIIGKVL